MPKQTPKEEVRVGISSCLLGHNVRYDGGHKRDSLVTGALAEFATFVPVCPEVEVGMPVPRPAVRLVRRGGEIRLIEPRHGIDHTEAMRRFSEERVRALARLDLPGYILKKDSPSCGVERVKVYAGDGPGVRTGTGLFARELLRGMPFLPVEEEGRLADPRLRESFVERIFAYRRLRALFRRRWTVGDLIRFHASEKLLLLAHDPASHRSLGRLVASARRVARTEVEARYVGTFLHALRFAATKGKNANALSHMAGYLRKVLAADEKAELRDAIADYRRGLVPLVVPMTLLRHLLRKHGCDYLEAQSFLEPHPEELMLRNHV